MNPLELLSVSKNLAPKHGGVPAPADGVLDFSASVNPLGMPSAAQAALQEAARWVAHYPDPECRALRQALAQAHGVAPESILCGNGSMELLFLLPRLFAAARAFQWAPTFVGYEEAVVAAGGQMESEGSPAAQLLFVCNPNNPTGDLYLLEELTELANRCEKEKKFLLIDEAFLEFAGPWRELSFLSRVTAYRWVGVLRSFTKIFALPGLRLGYLVAHPSWISRLRQLQTPWSVNALAQAVGLKLVGEEGFLEATRAQIQKFRKILVEDLEKIPQLKVFPSQANFLLIQIVSGNKSVAELQDFLRTKKIFIRNCADFRFLEGGKFFRIAVRKRSENQRLLAALKEFFSR